MLRNGSITAVACGSTNATICLVRDQRARGGGPKEESPHAHSQNYDHNDSAVVCHDREHEEIGAEHLWDRWMGWRRRFSEPPKSIRTKSSARFWSPDHTEMRAAHVPAGRKARWRGRGAPWICEGGHGIV